MHMKTYDGINHSRPVLRIFTRVCYDHTRYAFMLIDWANHPCCAYARAMATELSYFTLLSVKRNNGFKTLYNFA
jgi:hypothetical protein